MSLPLAANLQNSQCTIHGAASSYSITGDTLSVTLDIAFASGFSGNKVVYTREHIAPRGASWQASGTWSVPGPVGPGPSIKSVNPARSAGMARNYAFTFSGTNGSTGLAQLDILANNILSGAHACHVIFFPNSASSGKLFLANDAGDGYSSTLENSQCSIRAAESSVSSDGNSLTLRLAIEFRVSFAGSRVFYLSARDREARASGWQPAGTVEVAKASPRTYTTNFPLTETPISESGNWISGQAVGLDWSDVMTSNGMAQGVGPSWTAFSDPSAVLAGIWGPDFRQ